MGSPCASAAAHLAATPPVCSAKSVANWLEAVSSALPVVKPTTTGCEMSVTREPRRSAPMSACSSAMASASTPASDVRVAHGAPWSQPATACPPQRSGMALCVRMHMMAVGPTMSCGEAPASA